MGNRRRQRGTVGTPHSNDRAPRSAIRIVERSRSGRAVAIRLGMPSAGRLSASLRAALNGYRYAPVIVYDAAGKPVATMDPETRERKPL